jgi:hypothetical protein
MTSAGSVALVDRGGRETGSVTSSGSLSVFAGFRFPPEVISVAVRWYLRYGGSYAVGTSHGPLRVHHPS